MSTENTSKVGTNVELLRAALEQAKGVVEQLERDLREAEEAAATVAVHAMIETPEEPILVEPEPGFFGRLTLDIGPTRVSDRVVVIGRDSLPISFTVGGGVEVYLRAMGRAGRVKWCGFVSGRWDEVPNSDFCSGSMGWADAVRWARRMFAKWSADVAGVVAIAA